MEYITVNENGYLEVIAQALGNVTIPLDSRHTLSVRNENNQIEFAILDGSGLVTLRNDDTVMRVNDWNELVSKIRYEMGDAII
tara:strand:+ start:887 stop:1135 length:249 start_codon:yes stop_codon:yes gene_type:complete